MVGCPQTYNVATPQWTGAQPWAPGPECGPVPPPPMTAPPWSQQMGQAQACRPPGPRAGLDTKVVGDLQDNSLKQLIGNLRSSVSGNLLSEREVDIDTQEGDRLCISRIMDILNGKGNQGHRHLRHRARPLGTTHLRRRALRFSTTRRAWTMRSAIGTERRCWTTKTFGRSTAIRAP